MSGRADLHLHTTASDGVWSPEELVDAAIEAGLACIAVTDHDTVEGVAAAERYGRQRGLEVVPGVELSVYLGDTEVHVLGYFIDAENGALLDALTRYQAERKKRAERIVDRLRQLGFRIELQDVYALAGNGSVGRPHIAQALVEAGYAESVTAAFSEWLAEGRPAYIPRARMSFEQAITLIREAGGVAVCAHPGLLPDPELLQAMLPLGLDGIEVVHSAHDAHQEAFFNDFALHHALLRTGGSDAHGPEVKEDVAIGGWTIPMEWVEALASYSRLNK